MPSAPEISHRATFKAVTVPSAPEISHRATFEPVADVAAGIGLA